MLVMHVLSYLPPTMCDQLSKHPDPPVSLDGPFSQCNHHSSQIELPDSSLPSHCILKPSHSCERVFAPLTFTPSSATSPPQPWSRSCRHLPGLPPVCLGLPAPDPPPSKSCSPAGRAIWSNQGLLKVHHYQGLQFPCPTR